MENKLFDEDNIADEESYAFKSTEQWINHGPCISTQAALDVFSNSWTEMMKSGTR